ncbi:DnaJ homolog subfamily C member 10 [Mytilus galloprovincialis]|uniref:DnaJ homolog subfamily C member 10 n=1 Tax=Mytilus galloprovincialis TaxID=29158 RepID=A0A8B6GKL4_MYTGA|nr:DnaJ homolog subfamily C member 10 [Mytilus galloprovincialis]
MAESLRSRKGINYKSLNDYGLPALNLTDPVKISTPRKKLELTTARLLDKVVAEDLDSDEEGSRSDEELEQLRKKLKNTEDSIRKKKEEEKAVLKKKTEEGEKVLKSMKGEDSTIDEKVKLTDLRKMERLNSKVDKKLSDMGLFDKPEIKGDASKKKSKLKIKLSSTSSESISDDGIREMILRVKRKRISVVKENLNLVFRVSRLIKSKDILWWKIFLPLYNGVSMMLIEEWSKPDEIFSSDACMTGCGGMFKEHFFHVEFPDAIVNEQLHINALEMLTVVGSPKRDLFAIKDGGLHLNEAGVAQLKMCFIHVISHLERVRVRKYTLTTSGTPHADVFCAVDDKPNLIGPDTKLYRSQSTIMQILLCTDMLRIKQLFTSVFILFICVLTMTGAEDYYKLLGIQRSATTKEIRQAFKKLAVTMHPDKNPDDPEAHDNFLKINRAYEVLKDEDMRKKFDMHGEEGLKDDFHGGNRYESWKFYQEEFGLYDDDKEIITLSKSDFEQSVEESGDTWFINYYSAHCGHCHDLAPAWRELAQELAGVIRIGAVNCGDDWNLCRMQGIRSYPTLVMYPTAEKYHGDRTTRKMVKFALKKSQPDAYTLSGDCLSSTATTKLSAILTDLVNVASVDCHKDEKFCEKLGIEHGTYYYPTAEVAKDEGKKISSLNAQEIAHQVLSWLPDVDNLDSKTLKVWYSS